MWQFIYYKKLTLLAFYVSNIHNIANSMQIFTLLANILPLTNYHLTY